MIPQVLIDLPFHLYHTCITLYCSTTIEREAGCRVEKDGVNHGKNDKRATSRPITEIIRACPLARRTWLAFWRCWRHFVTRRVLQIQLNTRFCFRNRVTSHVFRRVICICREVENPDSCWLHQDSCWLYQTIVGLVETKLCKITRPFSYVLRVLTSSIQLSIPIRSRLTPTHAVIDAVTV